MVMNFRVLQRQNNFLVSLTTIPSHDGLCSKEIVKSLNHALKFRIGHFLSGQKDIEQLHWVSDESLILELPRSNLERNIIFPDHGFSWFPSVSSVSCQNCISRDTTVSSSVHSFEIHPTQSPSQLIHYAQINLS